MGCCLVRYGLFKCCIFPAAYVTPGPNRERVDLVWAQVCAEVVPLFPVISVSIANGFLFVLMVLLPAPVCVCVGVCVYVGADFLNSHI